MRRLRLEMAIRRNARPTWLVALAFVVVGAVGLHFGGKVPLSTWGPNITTSAWSLAITITVIEWATRREADDRALPRTSRAIGKVGWAFETFVHAVADDYAATHQDNRRPIPGTALQLFQLWIDEEECQDRRRPARTGARLPPLLYKAITFKDAVSAIRARDFDVLAPLLVSAIDDLGEGVDSALANVSSIQDYSGEERAQLEAQALRWCVRAAADFAPKFEACVPGQWWLNDTALQNMIDITTYNDF